MKRPTHIVIDGKRIPWRELLEMRREQLRAAATQITQPALFELREDHRPQHEASAANRYREPSLFEQLTRS